MLDAFPTVLPNCTLPEDEEDDGLDAAMIAEAIGGGGGMGLLVLFLFML